MEISGYHIRIRRIQLTIYPDIRISAGSSSRSAGYANSVWRLAGAGI
jgi:hypothetical protein